MPVNTNVDATDAQIIPTAEDYFLFYPEMKGQVTESQVTSMISGKSDLYTDWTKNLDPSKDFDLERLKIEGNYAAAISDKVANASNFLDQNFRAWCDENWERLGGEEALQAYCEMLHTTVNIVYLGRRVTNGRS